MNFRQFLENIDSVPAALQRGFIFVKRSENFSINLGNRQNDRGKYYFLGTEADTQLPLGKCLVAQNKVDACLKLGYSPQFVRRLANYNFDYPKDQRTPQHQAQFLQRFTSGSASHGTFDQFDLVLGRAARHAGYDTVILLKEPGGSNTATEVVDLRTIKMTADAQSTEDGYFD